MTMSLISRKEVLLAVVPGQDGETVVRYAIVNGRRILATGEGLPAHSGRATRACLFSLDSYFEQVDLAAASVKLLPLVARRHVDAELVFDDASYRLRARSRSRRERTIDADIAALPEHDLEEAISMLPMQQQPCQQLVPLELSIAALVNKATPEPVMVFWEKGGMVVSLLVAGGMVRTRMRERVTDENRDVILGRAEAGLKSSANHAGDNREVTLSLYLGELSGRKYETQEKAAVTLERKLARCFRGGRGVDGDAVLRDPELYGLQFVAESWNFLEVEYRTQVLAWRYAKPSAAMAAAAGVMIAIFGGVQHLQALNIASAFDRQRAELSAGMAEYQRIRPSDEVMAAVRSRLLVQEQSFSEVRLDRMLDWLTHLVPDGVVISALEMAPSPLPRQRTAMETPQYQPGHKPFDVKMEIVLGETALDAAEATAAEVVRRLSQRLHMVDSRLQVQAPEPGVRRNVVLVVRAQAQAVNFS
jgi:hypothetical protein